MQNFKVFLSGAFKGICYMKNKAYDNFHVFTTGLAIFAMFFGAGNLIYPFMVGLESGNNIMFGLAGFIASSVLLPLAGLITIILFEGNYNAFFNRLGNPIGSALIFICMIVIGPGLAIPRIITLSHILMSHLLPDALDDVDIVSAFLFALFFLVIVFFASYRKNRILDLLGLFIAPLLIFSLGIIIIKGVLSGQSIVPALYSPLETFTSNFIRGYETLDLLAGIFLCSTIIHLVRYRFGGMVGFNRVKLSDIGLKAGILGIAILALMYVGMALLSLYHAHDLESDGDLFQIISLIVLGKKGTALITFAILIAFISTVTALSAVVAEYFQFTIFKNKVSYGRALVYVLVFCIPLSTSGLDYVLELTNGPITYIGYPIIITLTTCNLFYKLFNFKPVKIPVIATLIVALISYKW